jgi:adenylyl-sulfate kinase
MIIWLTGLSGAGKSTIAAGLAKKLIQDGIRPLVIDGDLLRENLSRDLGYSHHDRMENIRRAASIALLADKSGITSICALISPLARERAAAREIAASQDIKFLEVFVSTPIHECESRDPKGLYKRARNGEIPNFTGIDSPYEMPSSPDLTIVTHESTIHESVDEVYRAVIQANPRSKP